MAAHLRETSELRRSPESLSSREVEYLKKETQRCAQVGAEASALTEESGELQEQVDQAPSASCSVLRPT